MDRFRGERALLAALRGLEAPNDYFSEGRTSPALWPERILCFARRSRVEIEVEPPTRHHHHRHVLMVPWRGRGEVVVDHRRFRLAPGHALLVLPFQFHHLHRLSPGPILWQFITFELREAELLETMRAHPLRRIEAAQRPLFGAFLRAWTEPRRHGTELAAWLSLLLHRLHNSPAPAGPRRPREEEVAPDRLLMARINRHCLPRLHELFGLKELAAQLGISESHLRARFREETGISLGRHVRRLRLQKAMSLLAQSELSVTAIAERCGFDTVFTFSRSFHRFAGVSAREYRRRRAVSTGHRKG
jgi:AraC-like DNA-binding protein/mannose-6-phosphate isomerase-like protein (cupin superfamily)